MLNKKLSALIIIGIMILSGVFHYQIAILLNVVGNSFAIRDVKINGATISKDLMFDQIIQKNIDINTLYTLDIVTMKAELEQLDFVKMVTIKKDFPFTLTIDVEERMPIAVLKTSSTNYIVDKEGYVLKYHDMVDLIEIKAQFGIGVSHRIVADEFLRMTLLNLSLIDRSKLDNIRIDRNRETYFTLKNFTPQFYTKKDILTSSYLQKAIKIEQTLRQTTNIKTPKIIDLQSYDDTFIGIF